MSLNLILPLNMEIERLTALVQSARDERDYAIRKAEEKWVAAEAKLDQARMLEGKSFKDENDDLKRQNKDLLEKVDELESDLRQVGAIAGKYYTDEDDY